MIRKVAAAALLIAVALVPACRNGRNAEREAQLANRVSSRVVKLYFESPEMLLAPETRTVSLPANDAAALGGVVGELLKGSVNAAIPHPFPPDTVLRGAYLLPGGNAVVDLGGPTLTGGWNTGSHAEMMAAYSVVQTLTTNFPSVRRVRFLVNGQPGPTLAGHIAIDRPLSPLRDVVAGP